MVPKQQSPANSELILKVFHERETSVSLFMKENAAGSFYFPFCLVNA